MGKTLNNDPRKDLLYTLSKVFVWSFILTIALLIGAGTGFIAPPNY